MADTRRLPEPITDVWDWQVRAACRGMNSDSFFTPDRERGVLRANREASATRICRRCTVIDDCRRHALSAEEPYGVWGGLTERDRREIRDARRAPVPQRPEARPTPDR